MLGDARFRLPEPATTVALSPDGKTVAAASGSNVLLFDAADGAYRRTLLGHTRELRRLAFSPDGDLLASSSLDGTVKLWKVADGREVRTLGGHKEAWAIAFSPDGKRLAVGTGDGAVFLWGVTEGKAHLPALVSGQARFRRRLQPRRQDAGGGRRPRRARLGRGHRAPLQVIPPLTRPNASRLPSARMASGWPPGRTSSLFVWEAASVPRAAAQGIAAP